MFEDLKKSLSRIACCCATDNYNPNEPRGSDGRWRSTSGGDRSDMKNAQLQVILKSNPANDDTHTWIRSVDDIKTAREAFEEDGVLEHGFAPDAPASVFNDALKTGRMKVYSSKPFGDGIFVTPSQMEASAYAGSGKVYSAEIPIDDIAWIDAGQGQIAKTFDTCKDIRGAV